jgi:hypothetical protein
MGSERNSLPICIPGPATSRYRSPSLPAATAFNLNSTLSTYSTGDGNGPLGLGWNLSVPGVSRKTSKGIPRYDDSKEVFILSAAEDLVAVPGGPSAATRYRPRTEALFAMLDQHHDAGDDTLNQVAICLHCGCMIAVFPERAFSAFPLTRFTKNRPLRKEFGPAHPCPCGKDTLDCRQKHAGMLPQGFHGSFHLWIDKAREGGDPILEAEYSSVQEARVVPGLEKDIDRHIFSTL